MKLEMTKFELYTEVQKNYKGYLTEDKALKLFKMENGYTPKILEDVKNGIVHQSTIDKINKENGNDYCTIEALIYMKELQESGVCNMIIGEIRNIIQTYLLISYEEATCIHKAYLKYYMELYYPEELL